MHPQAEKIADRIQANINAHRKAAQRKAAQRKAAQRKATQKKGAAKPAVPLPKSKHLPMPGLVFLGAGYDVFGRYASADDVKANIFDFTIDGTVDQQLYDESLPQVRSNVENAFTTMPIEIKLIYARPPGVQFKPLFRAQLDFSEGGSMSDEQQELSAHVDIEGSYGLFSGEFSARYSSSETRLATAKFFSVTACIRYYDLSMANYALRPLKYIRPGVRQDLNNASIAPEKIFEKYGTHYLYAVTIGSKIVYGHTVDTSKTTKSYDVAAEVRAKYGEPGAEVSGGGGIEVKGSSAQAKDAQSVKFYAEGVSDEQIAAAQEADTKPLGLLKQGWHNPTLIDFPDDALKPIWDLCDSEARRKALKQEFARYASTHSSIVGASADLLPLYLFRNAAGPLSCYRFSTNRNELELDGVTWMQAADDGKAALYVFAKMEPNTVPLYEYRHPTPAFLPGMPTVNSLLTRYETSRWEAYMASLGDAWTKASGNPVGWVYDGLEPAPASGSQDVYTYYPRSDGGLPRFLYSTDSADGRDTGGWRLAQVEDGAPLPNDLGAKAAAMAQQGTLKALSRGPANVHWRAPTL